jgi:hypothetical protein
MINPWREESTNEETFRDRAMRWPRMTMRRWAILIAVAAVDFTLIVQRASHPLATLAVFGTMAVVILLPAMLLLLALASQD